MHRTIGLFDMPHAAREGGKIHDAVGRAMRRLRFGGKFDRAQGHEFKKEARFSFILRQSLSDEVLLHYSHKTRQLYTKNMPQ
jgi:hypothetical protein